MVLEFINLITVLRGIELKCIKLKVNKSTHSISRGERWNPFKCYSIKKQIETFTIHPLIQVIGT